MFTSRTSSTGFLLLMIFLLASAGFAREPETVREPLPQGELGEERTLALPADAAARLNSKNARPAIDSASPFGDTLTLDGTDIRRKVTLLNDGFEGGFPGTSWTAFGQGLSDVAWGRSTRRRSTGNASAWCAQSGGDAPAPGQEVPPNVSSWLVTGPYDLSSFASGSFAFDLWLETEPGFDFLFVGASLDGTNFTAFSTDVNTSGWERFGIDLTDWGSLGDLTTRSRVFFAFIYETDGSVGFEGAYVDNVTLDAVATSGLNLVINQIDGDDCPTLRAIASVTDSRGNPVLGLTNQNFTLSEDGVQRTITTQTAGSGGDSLAVTLVLDGSGSLTGSDVANVEAASNLFIDLLGPSDRIAVYHFGTSVNRVQDYTTNRAAARAAVNALTNGLGFTSLFDAIVDAANHSATVSGRKALIVMTDGVDNDSSASQQDAIDAARANGVPVFTIGFGDADENVLRAIATQTGGLFFQGAVSGDLQTILDLVGQTLNSQYILTWTTSELDGALHDVTVQVQSQGQSDSQTVTYDQGGTPCASAVPCVAGPRTLCLNQGRFRVEVDWRNFVGETGRGQVANCGTDDSGIFWFFAPDNWEMLIKVLDGCGFNDRFWVFFSATTDVEYRMTVTDTRTGARKVYTNPLGTASPAVTDTNAFATCP